jgi:alpha-beta hydrolase superfamily lysophospholipase
MNRTSFEISVAGQSLHGNTYSLPDPKAVVLIVHGMGEYGRRYERFVIPRLLESGLSVVTYDQFGHGSNPGKKGHHPGYEYLLDSIDRCLEKSRQAFGNIPVVLYGHSMGGNVALNYVLSRPDKITGAIISSPFLRLSFEPPAWKLALGRMLGKILPSMTLANEIDASAISQIPEEVEVYLQDPLIHDRVSPAYSIAFMETGEKMIDRAGEISKPVLLVHGTADRLTDHGASRELAQRAGSHVEYHEVEGGYHELHHDLKRQEVMSQILRWTDELITNVTVSDENMD